MNPLRIAAWHGEGPSVFYVIDDHGIYKGTAPDVLASFHHRDEAEAFVRDVETEYGFLLTDLDALPPVFVLGDGPIWPKP